MDVGEYIVEGDLEAYSCKQQGHNLSAELVPSAAVCSRAPGRSTGGVSVLSHDAALVHRQSYSSYAGQLSNNLLSTIFAA